MRRVVPKAGPEDDDGEGDLDGGDDAVPPGASPGAGPCNLGNPGAPGNARGGNNSKNENNSVAAENAAERQRLNVWNLTAWRFLVLSGDIHGLDRGTDALRAHGRTGNDSQHEFHFHDQTVDVAVDSFRTLFCKRCHTYVRMTGLSQIQAHCLMPCMECSLTTRIRATEDKLFAHCA
jgi:hypothetical protein